MIRIAICDNEHCFVEQIHSILLSRAKTLPTAINMYTYTDGEQLLYDLEEGVHFDLLFLDIEMPETDGMSLAAVIRRRLSQSLVVFVTSHTKYAVKAFELSVFRYIPKSEMEVCLPLALEDACILLNRRRPDTYLIESPRRIVKISVDEIFYIYKNQKNAVIVTECEEISVRKPLGQVLEELCGQEERGFLMVERGYIVNLFHVDRLERDELILDNGTVLPASRRHIKEIRSAITRYWRSKL